MEIKINLVPPYVKKELEESMYLEILLRLGVSLLAAGIIFVVFLLAIAKILEINLSVASVYENDNRFFFAQEEIKKMDIEFEKINQQVKNIQTVSQGQYSRHNFFSEISRISSKGIEIDSLSLRDNLAAISGSAENRDWLIAYKDELEKNACFSDVELPLSSLVSKFNIFFQIDLKIREECLKRK